MLVHHPVAAGQTEHVSGWGWPDERDSWDWPDAVIGTNMTVRVFSKCSRQTVPNANGTVALTLNGKAVPGSPMMIGQSTEFVATFIVPYNKGALEASCTNLGPGAPTFKLTSAGVATGLKATVDRAVIANSRSDLAYVVVEVVDATGNRLTAARERLNFTVTGGDLEAVGTGDPTDISSFRQGTRVTYQGRPVAILRPSIGGAPGEMTLKVAAADATKIASTTVTVTIKAASS